MRRFPLVTRRPSSQRQGRQIHCRQQLALFRFAFFWSGWRFATGEDIQTTRAPTRGAPTVEIVCNRVRHTNGPIRFRQQLLPSTSGNALILRCEVQLLWICFLPLEDEATGSAENRQIDLFPSTTICFYLWQRLDPRESDTVSSGRNYPLDDQRDQVPKDGQHVSFSSTTIRFYLWQRPDPSVSGAVLLGRRFSPVPERPGFQEST